ncbi:ABC transporter substrate-binding protein [Sporanaerobium hydrogeniformans]|uniref:ABC transporter substrate-binding protein n=1 Tax=Sporanaerobium hydrogeniformans TaxID=3072179 RepID=UPI0015D47023|nr:ABC transporter substrate-binding protein [Sporanaerobium hydrogeniformans]
MKFLRKNLLKSIMASIMVLIMLLGSIGCNKTNVNNNASKEAAEQTQKPAESNEPQVDNDTEIVLAGYRNLAPGEKDGYYCSKILYVWEPLITQDENAAPIPCLAESWEMSEDGTRWTFNLRQGVQFHDGTDFNADAVIANFDRMKMGIKKSSFYPLDIDSHYPNLTGYEKTGEYQICLTFSVPSPTQLYNMVNFGSAIFSPTGFDEEGNFKGIVQGTGPFKMKENVLNEYVLLERNEDYYGEKAKAKTMRIKVIPDADTRFSALKAGEIMGVIDLNAIPAALAVELEGSEDFALTTTKSTMIRFLAVNGTTFPFNDVRMRQALSLALDRNMLTDELYYGFATPTTNILNYATPFYKEIPVNENMEQAKALAQEVLGDEKITVTYLYNSGEATQKAEAELISSWLSEIGINCELQPMEMATMKEEMKKGEYGLARLQQGLSNSEPATIFRRFMLTSGDHNQNYVLGYQSDEVDELMAKASEALDMTVRTECYNRIQEISTKELPVIPLFNDTTLMAYSTKLTGYEAKLYGIELPQVTWSE